MTFPTIPKKVTYLERDVEASCQISWLSKCHDPTEELNILDAPSVVALLYASWALVTSRTVNSEKVSFDTISQETFRLAPDSASMALPFQVRCAPGDMARDYLDLVQACASYQGKIEPGVDCASSKDLRPVTLMVVGLDENALSSTNTNNDTPTEAQRHAVVLHFQLTGTQLRARATSDSRVTSPWFLQRLLKRLEFCMQQIHGAGPATCLSDIDDMSPDDMEQIWRWNSPLPVAVERCMHDIFEDQAQSQPLSLAIDAWDGQLSYAELDKISERLAGHLLSIGVGPEVIVPLCFEKSMWMPIAMMGVLKAGGAFTLLDSSFPENRLRTIIDTVGASTLLCSPSTRPLCSGLVENIIQVDTESSESFVACPTRQRSTQPPSTAMFAVFTSGSTGVPKGAVLTHTNYASALSHQLQSLGFTRKSRIFDFASYAFDVSVHNVFATLTCGACLCIPSDQDRRDDISTVMRNLRVTIAHLTPSVALLIEPDSVPLLKTMVFTGEALAVDDVTRWWGKVNIVNEYGPAECTINTVNSQPSSPEAATSIGTPVGVSGWIVNPDNHDLLVPIGCTGELLVEGPLVGRGYINDPVKTASSFIEHPNWLLRGWADYSGRTGRLYKTGDLVQYNEDGSLSFVGRMDTQVKIRGQRVDLGEVEHWSQAFLPEADQVVAEVIVPQAVSPVPTLAVFAQYREAAGCISDHVKIQAVPADVQAQLARHLPSYFVPTVVLWMKKLPLTPTGKMDRRTLRDMGSSFTAEEVAYARADHLQSQKRHPSNEMEETLREIWGRVLGIKPEAIGMEDNFFNLGGDSIASMKAVADSRRIGILVSVADVFRHSNLSDLAKNCSRWLGSATQHITPFQLLGHKFDKPSFLQDISSRYKLDPASIQDAYPCTRLQEGLIFLTSKRPGDYIEQRVLELAPDISMDGLRNAWEGVVKAMPIMRTRIVHDSNRGLLQLIVDEVAHWTEAKGLQDYLKTDRKQSMELGDPLSHFSLVKDELNERRWLVWTLHHAIYDGWSVRLVTDAVTREYQGQKFEHAPQFQTFIRYIQDQDPEAAAGYWRSYMEGFEAPLFPPLVPGINQPVADTSVGHRIPHPKNKISGITTSMLIRAAWGLVMGRMVNSNDAVFGTTLHGRNAPMPGLDEMVAPTIATAPVRVKFFSNQTASKYLESVQQEAADMMLFEQTGLEKIATASAECARACQFQTHLVIQPEDRDQKEGLLGQWRSDAQEEWFSTYALTVEIWLGSSEIDVSAMFDSRVIQPWVVTSMLQRLEWTMHQLDHATPSLLIDDVQMLSKRDLEQIWLWNGDVPERVDKCIHDLLAKQARERPSCEAICAWDGKLTYGQLDELSTKLASRLLELGVGLRNEMVPLCFEKSMWTVVTMMGVLKTGASFILLDPALPEGRVKSILEQVDSKAIIACPSMEGLGCLVAEKIVAIGWDFFADLDGHMHHASLPLVSPLSIAYGIFTSGSTGTPKCATVTHSNVVSAQHHQVKLMGHTPDSRLFDFCSYSFDVSISNMASMLACGGCLCIPKESDRKGDLESSIISLGSNALDLTPSTLQLLSPQKLPAIRLLTLGGEPLKASDIDEWQGRVRICNAYGPSECTPTATINANPTDAEIATRIGKGAGAVTWIVDPADPDNLVPPGCIGELLLEGPVVGRGYLGDPERTAKVFIEDPQWLLQGSHISPGRSGRLYRTGDLAKYNPDGTLTYVGRKDNQVKLRGQRIELGEVEEVLLSHECTNDAVVVLQGADEPDPWLAGFVTICHDDDEPEPRGDKLAAVYAVKLQQEEQNVQGWGDQFDEETYADIDRTTFESVGRDFIGWSSMYDGSEIDKWEMNEWLDDSVASILDGRLAGCVLEIGCGTGMMLFNLAKHGLESYIGLDPAARAIEFTARAAKCTPGLAEKVTVFKGTAEDVLVLDMPASPTLVVINSVVQYFPSLDYLLRIINHLVSLGTVSTIFLGDIRSFALHREFSAKRALHMGAEDASRKEFGQIIENLGRSEPELLLDPGFFTSLPNSIPGVKHVEILPKTMKATNELSSYRYAAVLHVNNSPSRDQHCDIIHDIERDCWVDYASNNLNYESISSMLNAEPAMVAISNIPYSKISYEREIVRMVELEDLRSQINEGAWLKVAQQQSDSKSSLCAFDLVQLAQQAAYRVEVSWARQYSQHGGLDAVFYRSSGDATAIHGRRSLFRFPTDHEGRALHTLSSNPLSQQREGRIRQELEQLLKAQLPSYMVPHSISILEKIPVNRNGKKDRRKLSENLVQRRTSTVGTRRAPTTESEKKMQHIWSTVLNMELNAISLDDGFIQLGGNSLGAMKIVNMAREAGIVLEVADMFRHATTSIAHLVRNTTENEDLELKESSPDHSDSAAELLMSEITKYDTVIAAAQAEAKKRPNAGCDSNNGSSSKIAVALTGANGFVGTQILRQLLESGRVGRVIAIVRGASAAQARQRVIDAAMKAQWWTEFHGDMLDVWDGDLAEPKLGLADVNWAAIVDGAVDVLIHNGASVHFMKSYSALKSANVESTVQVLRAAAENTRTKIVYVSSARCSDPDAEVEEDVARAIADSPNGYNETKFVSEALVRRAAARSPEVRESQFAVVSPGLVVGTPTEGVSNADDWFWRVAAACIRVGSYNGEDSDSWVPIADAAATATTVMETALGRSTGVVTQVKGGLTMGEFWEILNASGYTVRKEEASKWVDLIGKDVQENRDSHPLGALAEMLETLRDTAKSDWAESWKTGDISSPARLKAALRKSAEFLSRVGFLPSPAEKCQSIVGRIEGMRAFTRSGG